jgi:rhomboid family GlyGly-CTERM serine protease
MPCASLLLSVAAAVVFLLPALGARLEYDRAAVAAGEVWRFLSSHWTHYSLDHLFWDVLAFAGLGVACEGRGRIRFLVCLAAAAVVIPLGIWLLLPGMTAYRGLSGLDSALLGLLAAELGIEGVRSQKWREVALAAVCLGGFLLKVFLELTTGANLFVSDMGPGTVGVPLAHVIGAMVGVLVGSASAFFSPAPQGERVVSGRHDADRSREVARTGACMAEGDVHHLCLRAGALLLEHLHAVELSVLLRYRSPRDAGRSLAGEPLSGQHSGGRDSVAPGAVGR